MREAAHIRRGIAQRRHAAGKRVILYLPSDNDGRMRSFMGAAEPYTPRYREFVRAYSEKFGRLCDGWWFDACGPLPDAEWQDWIAVCRAGNPDAAFVSNAGRDRFLDRQAP